MKRCYLSILWVLPLISSIIQLRAATGADYTVQTKGAHMKNQNTLELKTKFATQEYIPMEFTCEGGDKSPELSWTNIKNAKSYVLIVDDPDAPRKFLKPDEDAFVHWILFNIPPAITFLPDQITAQELSKSYILVGTNSSGQQKYMGPCPPAGAAHNYRFKLYALDTKLPLATGATKAEVQEAMAGHIIDQTELVGMYRRHFGTHVH